MKYLTILILIAALCSSVINAQEAQVSQEIEIGVPRGWAASESGIVKGNNELSVGPVIDLGELSAIKSVSYTHLTLPTIYSV